MVESVRNLRSRSTSSSFVSIFSAVYKFFSMGRNGAPPLQLLRRFMLFFDLVACLTTLITGACILGGSGALPCLSDALISQLYGDSSTNDSVGAVRGLNTANGWGLLLTAAHYVALMLLNSPWCTERGRDSEG